MAHRKSRPIGIQYHPVSELTQVLDIAEGACAGGSRNLILPVVFPAKLIDSKFVETHRETALMWQAPKVPRELHFNHGENIHAYGDAIAEMVSRLKATPNSSKAFFTVTSMERVIRDRNHVPSYLLHQCAVDNGVLHCTMYFRALEVTRFLAINLTEMCLIAHRIRDAGVIFQKVALVIHAFRAFARSDFDCLRKSEMDLQDRGAIALAVAKGNVDFIHRMLTSKEVDSSIISSDGIEELNTAVSECAGHGSAFSAKFAREIKAAHACLRELEKVRARHAFADTPQELYDRFRQHIARAKQALKK